MTHTPPATAIEAATPVRPKRTLWRTLGVLIVGLAMLPSYAVARRPGHCRMGTLCVGQRRLQCVRR